MSALRSPLSEVFTPRTRIDVLFTGLIIALLTVSASSVFALLPKMLTEIGGEVSTEFGVYRPSP